MDINICRKCKESKCWLAFNTHNHTMHAIPVSGLEHNPEFDLYEDWDKSTHIIRKEGDEVFLETEQLCEGISCICTSPVSILKWKFDDYFPTNDEFFEKNCQCYTEQMVAYYNRKKK